MTVATVTIAETNGSGATVTNNVTNINFGSVDAVNLTPANNPIQAGNNSFEKWLRYYLSAINDSNKIDNFQVWMTTASADPAGVSYFTNLNTGTLPTDSYPAGGPVSSDSTYADQSMPTGDPGAENIGVSGGSGGLSTNGTYSDYMVFQLKTTGSAPPGDLPQKTFHFQYDEQ